MHGRGDVTDSAVQTLFVIDADVLFDQALIILQASGTPGRMHSFWWIGSTVPSCHRIVGSKVVHAVGHAGDPNELHEVRVDELRPVVGDDPRGWSPHRDDL